MGGHDSAVVLRVVGGGPRLGATAPHVHLRWAFCGAWCLVQAPAAGHGRFVVVAGAPVGAAGGGVQGVVTAAGAIAEPLPVTAVVSVSGPRRGQYGDVVAGDSRR